MEGDIQEFTAGPLNCEVLWDKSVGQTVGQTVHDPFTRGLDLVRMKTRSSSFGVLTGIFESEIFRSRNILVFHQTDWDLMYGACLCVKCEQRIEFPSEMAGQTIDCPTCAQPLILPEMIEVAALSKERKSLFAGFMGVVAGLQEKHRDRAFRKDCVDALNYKLDALLADGELEPHEVEQLSEALAFFGQSGFSLDEADASKLFSRIVSGIHWTADTDMLMGKIQEAFRLSSLSPAVAQMMSEKRFLLSLETGKAPPIETGGVLLKSGETALWREPGVWLEERVIRRRYEGGSRGVSIRVMKGVSFRVGAHRGQMVSETGLVPVSHGNLLITSRQIYFAGDRKSFSVKYDDISQLELLSDGLVVFEAGREKPRSVRYKNSKADSYIRAALNGVTRTAE